MSDLPPPSSNPPDVPPPSAAPVTPPEVPPVESTLPAASVEMKSDGDPDPQPKDSNERTLGIVMHLIPVAGIALAFIAIPMGNLLAPLIFWLIKRHESAYLDSVGKEVLNFQLYLGAVSLLAMIPFLGCLLVPVLWAGFLASLVLMVMAAIAVSDGKFYRYPWIRRFIQ